MEREIFAKSPAFFCNFLENSGIFPEKGLHNARYVPKISENYIYIIYYPILLYHKFQKKSNIKLAAAPAAKI
jgi:hypothetical protein